MTISNKIKFGDVTILVNTCDLYHDVWPLFFAALNEYWPNRSYDLLLNTEKRSAEGIKVHNFLAINGNNSWGLRLRETLESIKTKYVLALYDDFIVEATINESELQNIITKMNEDESIAVIYLTELGLKTQKIIEDDSKYVLLEDYIDFRLNSAPALWRREDLLRYTGPHDNPWAWEVFGSYRTYGDGKKMYSPSSPANDVYIYNHKKGGAIYRGKWVAEVVVEKNKKYNLNIDFTKRGFSFENDYEKRSFSWKVNFVLLGFKMVGFKSLLFLLRTLKVKLHV